MVAYEDMATGRVVRQPQHCVLGRYRAGWQGLGVQNL